MAESLIAYLRPEQGQVIQITSPEANSGKTTVAANLAVGLAQMGKKVAIVDADLRSGTLHRIFEVSAAKGITSAVIAGTDIDELMQHSPLASVDVLTKGPAAKNPLHLLAQPEMEKIFEVLSQQYDVVLVDSPAVLALSDASLLATSADIVLLVLRSGLSSSTSPARFRHARCRWSQARRHRVDVYASNWWSSDGYREVSLRRENSHMNNDGVKPPVNAS